MCKDLKELRIVLSPGTKYQFPTVGNDAFAYLPDPKDRKPIIFVDEQGNPLTKEALADAGVASAFAAAAASDDDGDDSTWYGWRLEEMSGAADTYKVAVKPQLDGQAWTVDCDKSFALTKDNGASFVTDLDAVEKAAAPYAIYDVTGVSPDDYATKGVDTGVTVTVADKDESATVDYYTASFYDYGADGGEQKYGEDTDWKPQTVLKTVGRVTRPLTDPTKDGYTFEKWVQADKATAFDFSAAEITAPTKIYAKWTKNIEPTYAVTIRVRKDGQTWNDHGKTFALRDDGKGGLITDLTQVPNGTYSIYDTTGVPADSLYSGARDTGMDVRVNGADTGVDVTVNGADEEAYVDYYTATFHDGAAAYPSGTPQEPQIVLKGQKVMKPENPGKADYDFAGWKTADGGSKAYDFDTVVTGTTSIYASWVKKAAEQFHITASSTEGGTISPKGDTTVTKGGELIFTIMPDEGKKIKAVTVDDRDVTAALADTLARAQTGARYYTFTNVTQNHTIHAVFENDGGGDNTGDNNKPGDGEDKPGDGEDKPGGGEDKPGGGNDNPGGGNDNPSGGNNPQEGGDSTGNEQTVAVIKAATPQAESNTVGNAPTTGGSEQEEKPLRGKEPQTGEAVLIEVYATVAMIAGLTYLLLYFMEEGRGMTEREKEVFVAAFIRWAKKGGRFRKCCAVAAIFCLLVYYHSIGKRAGKTGLDRECLKQAL